MSYSRRKLALIGSFHLELELIDLIHVAVHESEKITMKGAVHFDLVFSTNKRESLSSS